MSERKVILLVEDDLPELFESILKKLECGPRIIIAEDLPSALLVIACEDVINVVVTDMHFPKGDVLEDGLPGNIVANAAKAKGIPVIGMSNQTFKFRNVDKRLKKPFGHKVFLDAVVSILK